MEIKKTKPKIIKVIKWHRKTILIIETKDGYWETYELPKKEN